jgi:hypothetical protein
MTLLSVLIGQSCYFMEDRLAVNKYNAYWWLFLT